MNRNMKTLLTVLSVALVGGAARAANPVSVDVWVQVQNLSIAVTTSTSYDYGVQQFAASAIQATKFTFQNNGNASEQFQYGIDNVNSTAITPVGLWAVVNTVPAAEQVRLGLVLKTTAAVAGDFAYPTDALTTGPVTAGTTSPSTYIADIGSINPVAVGATRDGYTQIWLPSTTTQYTHVKIIVLANAIP